MYPKPHSQVSTLPKRLSGARKAMTVAIGMYGIGGLFVCTDSHVVSSDGIVTSGFKLSGTECGNGTFVIGNAADDGNAATMLAQDILDSLEKSKGQLGPAIKKTMKEWHSGYVHSKAPSVQFILAVRIAPQHRSLYFCEPPNTILRKSLDEVVVSGIGSQILDPLVPEVIRGPLYLKEALIRAAYLMYRAKKDHAFLKGSETDALIVYEQSGAIRPSIAGRYEGGRSVRPGRRFYAALLLPRFARTTSGSRSKWFSGTLQREISRDQKQGKPN